MSSKKAYGYRILFYLIGLLALAIGLTLNTKAGLGVSPIISVSYSVSVITGQNFGNMTFVLYGIFVVIELALHTVRILLGKMGDGKGRWLVLLKDALQFPLSLVFTRFLNVFSAAIPDFSEGPLAVRLVVLLFAILFTGVGAALSLNMRIIPNPGDGIVQAIADCIGKSVGFTKNCFDLLNICITFTIGMAFTGHLVGIGLGTVLAVLGVGRVIAFFNHFTFARVTALSGLAAEV